MVLKSPQGLFMWWCAWYIQKGKPLLKIFTQPRDAIDVTLTVFFGDDLGISEVSWEYLWDILRICWGYLGVILGTSGKYLGNILGISWEYLGNIFGASWAYCGDQLGISRENLWDITMGLLGRVDLKDRGYLGLSWEYLWDILIEAVKWHKRVTLENDTRDVTPEMWHQIAAEDWCWC